MGEGGVESAAEASPPRLDISESSKPPVSTSQHSPADENLYGTLPEEQPSPEEADALAKEAEVSEAELEPVLAKLGDLADVWVRFKASGTQADHATLCNAYLPLARYLAERMRSRLPDEVEMDDLMQDGSLGLMEAINDFDLSRNIKFETYCAPRIRGAILDGLRERDWVPRLDRYRSEKYNSARGSLQRSLGRAPTEEEVQGKLGLSEPMFGKYRAAARDAHNPKHAGNLKPNDSKRDSDEDPLNLDQANLAAPPAEGMRDLEDREIMRVLLNSVDPQARQVLNMFLYDGLSLKEIGDYLDLSESRISQLMGQTLEIMVAYVQGGEFEAPGSIRRALWEEFSSGRRRLGQAASSGLTPQETALLEGLNERASVQFRLGQDTGDFHDEGSESEFQGLVQLVRQKQRNPTEETPTSDPKNPQPQIPSFTFSDDPPVEEY